MYFLSCSELDYKTSENWLTFTSFFFSEKCACEDQHRGRAQHSTCTTPNTHSCNAAYHQLAPATDPHAKVWRYKIWVRYRDFSPVNIPSHIWVTLPGLEVNVPTTPCPYTNPRSANREPGAQAVLLYPLCAGPSFRPCLRSSTGCSCLLFTCFCFHLVCLIHLMKGCHGDRYRGWGYPWCTYMAVCVDVAFQTHILWRRYGSLVVSTHVQASCTHVVQYNMLTSSFQAICSKPVKSCAIADCRIFSRPLQLDLSVFYYINFLRLKRWKEVLV